MNSNTRKSKSELRKFGLSVGIVLGLIAAFLFWRGKDAAIVLGGVSAVLIVLGLVLPTVLRPVEYAWMRLALVLSFISTRVILTLAFFLVILPFGIVLRLIGKDLLSLRINPGAETYWIETEADGPRTRPGKPY